ncbi:MAG: Crp/Fnr family transcriptional regulator [Deltaproteobacteria bacterium]|nr:Crp/Fnr family transcriptional regulator [Deltaproteobacteria bacterium]
MITTAQKQLCLQSCRLFSGLDSGTLGVLAAAVEVEQFAEGEEVCLHGEEADCIFVIMQGAVGVLLPGADTPIRSMGPGEIFGEYGMFKGVRTTSIISEQRSVLLSMDYTRFKDFLFHYPDALYNLLEVAVDRLEQAEQRARNA